MKKVLLVLLGLLTIGVLAYFCFQDKINTIKSSLETSATNILQSNNINGVEARLVGDSFESTSIMRLTGEVNTAETKKKASHLLSSISGITSIDNQLQVASIQTALTENSTIEKSMNQKLEKSKILPTISEDTSISPYIATIQKDKNNHLTLDGYVNSDETKDIIALKANKLFGVSNVTNNLKIASGQPESWSDMIKLGLDKLKNVDYGELNIHDNNYAFNGTISSANAQSIKKEILESANKEMLNYSNYLGSFEIDTPKKELIELVEITQKDTIIKTPKECQKALKKLTSTKKILFEYNKAIIKKDSTVLLDEIVKTLQNCNLDKIKVIEIGGHTDSIGSYIYNKELSQKRANSVKNYIQQHDIDSAKLKAIGYGEKHPIQSNMLKTGRAKNRRIEFIIKEIN